MVCQTALALDVIDELRGDANLRYVYAGPQKKRGARRKYDGKVDFSGSAALRSLVRWTLASDSIQAWSGPSISN